MNKWMKLEEPENICSRNPNTVMVICRFFGPSNLQDGCDCTAMRSPFYTLVVKEYVETCVVILSFLGENITIFIRGVSFTAAALASILLQVE